MDIIIELAEAHPLVFLGLLGVGLIGSLLVFTLAFKITKILLKIIMVFLSLVAFCVLGLIALVTAEHIIGALQYDPPPPSHVQPAQDTASPPTQQ
jgi:hypothetical protein